MKSLVDALQKENMKHGIKKGVPSGKKKASKKSNTKNPDAKQAAGGKGKFLHLIGAS